jgi:CHAT domain-containing protein
MRRRDLAARLVSASSAVERRRLLKANMRVADARLAREIKDICYRKWTAEPAAAQRAAVALHALETARPNDHETAAVALWIAGIANITRSRFEHAVEDLDTAAKLFRSIGKPADAAQTEVAKLIALGLVGRYDEADRTGRAALRTFEKAGDQLAAGKIEMNLSNVAARRERHLAAEAFALSALRRFKKLGERSWQTMAENDLANTYSEMNDFRKAERYFAMAAESARAAGMRLTEAEIEASMGNLELFRGRSGDALRLLELSRQKYEELQMPHQTAIAELEISEVYVELNLIDEAVSTLESVVGRLRRYRLCADEARGRALLARLYLKVGDAANALRETRRARTLYVSENNQIGVARTELLQAEAEIKLGRAPAAIETAERATGRLRESGNLRLAVAAKWLRGEAMRLNGRRSAARSLLSETIKDATKNEQPAVGVAAMNSLGKLALQTGDRRAAKATFRRAVGLVEKMREPIASDEFRMAFLAGQLEPFQELLKIAIDEGRLEEALLIHEAARARSLVDVVRSHRVAGRSGTISGKLDELREELNWFYSRLTRAAGDETAKLEKEIASRERRVTQLTRQLDAVAARSVGEGERLDLDQLKQLLGKQHVLIEYVAINEAISVFAVTGKGIEFVSEICREDDIRKLLEGLRFQFGTLRYGGQALQTFLPQLKRNAEQYLEKLYELLLTPIKSCLNVEKLIVAPTGILNYVPFNALFDGGGYLVERTGISITPSARIWLLLSRKRPRRTQKALLMAYSDEAIPLAESEVHRLKRAFENSVVLTGGRATFSAYLENAPSADIIHLACHGRFRSDNPMFSSLHLADGWITVRDISRQRLKAGLVTLSACETGLSEIRAGDELLGLTRGFLTAGARNMIVSLWTVSDEATSRLMTEFYRLLQRGNAPAASLRAAQIEFIRRGVHPYYWSPFISFGV